jgi:RNA polymerase sigma factor (sigma-70 family)
LPNRTNGIAHRRLHSLFNLGSVGQLTDGQLLERFTTSHGEAGELAFAALVERHGPMVLHVCRSILRDEHEAHDAFQATFLVLLRKARSLWVRDSLAPWLHQVAYRAACSSRSTRARRRDHERRAAALAPTATAVDSHDPGAIGEALHEEIRRLPERFRVPLVLCDLGGLSHEQAARHLGCPVGTVKSRLARGRQRLGDRLRRRDPSLDRSSPRAWIATGGAVTLPAGLADVTASAALRAAAGRHAAGTLPAAVLSLANGALWMMRLDFARRCTVTGLALAVLMIGPALAFAGWLSDPVQRPPTPTEAELPGPSHPPQEAAVPREPETTVSFEVTFLQAPGLSFRQSGIDFDLHLEPPAGIAFLSDLEVRLLTEHMKAVPGARVGTTSEFSARPGEQAVIGQLIQNGQVATLIRSDPNEGPDPTDARPGPSPRRPPIRPECTVRLQGHPSADGRHVSIDMEIHDLHVIEVHTADVPGHDGHSLVVPEVVRSEIDQRVTLPSGGTVLISLGLQRTVGDFGDASISERLVLIRARNPTTRASTP